MERSPWVRHAAWACLSVHSLIFLLVIVGFIRRVIQKTWDDQDLIPFTISPQSKTTVVAFVGAVGFIGPILFFVLTSSSMDSLDC